MMRTIFKLLTFAAICALSVACGQRAEDRHHECTAAIDADRVTERAVHESPTPTYTLTANSLGAIRIGMDVTTIPESMPGLYREYNTQPNEINDGNLYTLSIDPAAGTGDIILIAGTEDNAIDGIQLPCSTRVDVSINGRILSLPDVTAADLFENEDCRAFHIYWAGLFVYTGDLTFFFDMEALTDEAREKVDSELYSELELNASDFRPQAKPNDVLAGSMNYI